MIRTLLLILALLAASPALAANSVATLLNTAIALACAEDPVDLDAMAEALPGTMKRIAEDPIVLGDETFGWRRQFTFVHGGMLHLTRLTTWRRIEAEYSAPHGGGARPETIIIVDAGCRITMARRLIYNAAGIAEAIEILGPDLAPTGERERLNPAAPPGMDPGGVTVALVDSGVNYLLPAIAGGLARHGDGALVGYDYRDMDARPFDADPARSPFFPQRHGTRVASVILAAAPAVRLIPYRYPRPDSGRLVDLITDAAKNGARIVNLAMASNRIEHWDGFRDGVAAHPDILFVVSAGDDNRDLDRRPIYPAAFNIPNMLVIAAADGFGEPAPGSNWGKATVDLLVPGEQVPVIDFHGAATTASGARFAAPQVTALAARLLVQHPDWTATELKAAIIAKARLVDASGRLTSRYGFLDLNQ
ncbi:MAG: S8 family serine peptidase [Alphaproteobacteria bacterium]